MNKQHKLIKPLTGHFLGWGDDSTPHRYIKLATNSGEQIVKVAKSLRPQIQDWQPGMLLTLLSQQRISLATGETKIKVKQLLISPSIDPSCQINSKFVPTDEVKVSTSSEPTKIRVCHGSSCRRRGAEKICKSMQAYLEHNDLTSNVKIEEVKCLHQCKAAPHVIVSSPATAILSGKTHYRQLQPDQVPVMLAKHFPTEILAKPIGSNLIEKIGNYLSQHRVSISNNIS
ncbi:MAG: (2Fe-2S) ferredoxin domain-containing protein [Chamaesiphon sp.]|nr:(2Fe-2S) ferredoxin domain-containing protein [Chamaesiphon sp.]